MSPLLVELIGWSLLLLGVVLSLAGLPGPFVSALAVVLFYYVGSWKGLGVAGFIILITLLIIGEITEQLGGFVGMHWSGIRPLGWKLAIVGGIIGVPLSVIFLNPLLIVVGMIGGAWAGETLGGSKPLEALKVALGFAFGKFGGYVVKNVISLSVLLYLLCIRTWPLVT